MDKKPIELNLFKNVQHKIKNFIKPIKKENTDVEYEIRENKNKNIFLNESYSSDSDIIIEKESLEIKNSNIFDNDFELAKPKENESENINEEINNIIKKHKNLEKIEIDCILYDQLKQEYNIKIKFDNDYNFLILNSIFGTYPYFNEKYLIFNLLNIKNYIYSTNFIGKTIYYVNIILKDYREFSFKINPDNFKKLNEVIEEYSQPKKNINFLSHSLYKNHIFKNENIKNKYIDGWTIYNPQQEFETQGINFNEFLYKIADNSNFQICDTYPKMIIVPYIFSDEDLKICASFRAKQRLPILTYFYKTNGKCIWRSSQTLSGIYNKNEKDILFLTKISENDMKLHVYDCRPMINALANKIKGAGYEDITSYPTVSMKLIFCDMPNIHAVRGSCHKLYSDLSYDTENGYKVINNLEGTLWYDYIITFIKSSFQVAETIKSGINVLIHCSDGWDRTAQLCSMAQIILDKRYRTLDGFICLIEKDWVSMGHQFKYRCGMYSESDVPSKVSSENQKSPIFIQFLDALYQIVIQNYTKFEYNTDLFYFLANEMYNGNYGTFMFNNEKERDEFQATKNTMSIWTFVKNNEYKFLNPIYDENDNGVINFNYKMIKLWEKYFYRFEKCEDKKIELYNNKMNELKQEVQNSKNIIGELKNIIIKNNIDISHLEPNITKIFKE